VVPVFNEELSLETLLREIQQVAKREDYDVRVLFVDDGSTDNTWATITQFAANNPAVGGVRFRQNFGKSAALMAGFAEAQGEVVFTMDADLQDPPEEMPRLLRKIDVGYDVVSGWKQDRHDPWHKVYPSRIFNALISLMTGVELHDHVCGLKCYRHGVLKYLRIYGEFHRFLGVLAGHHGFKVTEVPTQHRPRTTGYSKYGFSRFAKGFMDLFTVIMLTRYAHRPQHLIGVTGLWLLLLSPILMLLPFLAIPMLALTLVAGGLLAGLIVAQQPSDNLYEITERTGWCAAESTDDLVTNDDWATEP